jgi:hypothetical protein
MIKDWREYLANKGIKVYIDDLIELGWYIKSFDEYLCGKEFKWNWKWMLL